LLYPDYARFWFRIPDYPATFMYLIAIAWIYVVLMMSIAEATNTTGTVLGAIMTFVLYGVLPLALVLYLMNSPARRRAIKARERAELSASRPPEPVAPLEPPDASGHSPGAAPESSVTPVRKET
jgi:hypothetical protein